MLNYWWVTRPKRKLDSVPDVLTVFAGLSLDQEWRGQRETQLSYEDALEQAGLKRIGSRRDQSGSGARTYWAWLQSLGLIFRQTSTGNIKLTLAGEAIMNGKSPTAVLKNQILKYQFPSAFSVSRNVQVHPRFCIHPFWFLFRLLADSRISYLTQSEIARIIIVEAENDDRCYESIVNRILQYRAFGVQCLAVDFFEQYKPGRGEINPDHPYSHLEDVANTIINWMEYTQLARRNDDKQLEILPSATAEVQSILKSAPPFIEKPDDHEFFQRKYGVDPWHRKDTRNLMQTKTVTTRTFAEFKVQQAYLLIASKQPVTKITTDLINRIADETGIITNIVEEVLKRRFPYGSFAFFMNEYFNMAFSGREQAVDFEKATTDIFHDIFGYNAIHLGQTGSKSAPDILLLSDSEGYQSIIDNKAYTKYTISTDHHNRMVHNYIGNIQSYNKGCPYPIGYFSYIAGGFGSGINKQIQSEAVDSGVHGSCITVSDFMQMIEKHQNGSVYSHADLRRIFSVDRQITIADY